jgi:hypothetical protein
MRDRRARPQTSASSSGGGSSARESNGPVYDSLLTITLQAAKGNATTLTLVHERLDDLAAARCRTSPNSGGWLGVGPRKARACAPDIQGLEVTAGGKSNERTSNLSLDSNIHDGKLDEFKRLSRRNARNWCVPKTPELCSTSCTSTATTPSVLSLSGTGTRRPSWITSRIWEDTMAAILQTCSGSGEVCGTASPELIEQLKGSPVYRSDHTISGVPLDQSSCAALKPPRSSTGCCRCAKSKSSGGAGVRQPRSIRGGQKPRATRAGVRSGRRVAMEKDCRSQQVAIIVRAAEG